MSRDRQSPHPLARRGAPAPRTTAAHPHRAWIGALAMGLAGVAWAQPGAAPVAAPQAVASSPPETLSALVARVLSQDPGVRVQALLLQATDERRKQAFSRLLPNVGLTTNRGSSNVTEESLFGSNLPFDRRTDRTEASIRWNLYNYGNDAAELRGARIDVNAAAEEVRRAREETAERIAEAYLELWRVQEVVPASTRRMAAVRGLVQQVGQQNQAGKVSDADLQQAQASLLDAEVVHEQLLADLAGARERLAAVSGTELREALPVELPALTATAEPRNGQVNAARERADAARERVRPMASLIAPRIDLEYRQRLSDHTTPASTTTERFGWSLTARWDFPVGGENFARRAEGERRAEATVAEAERVQRAAQTELVALPSRIAQSERAVGQIDQQIVQYNSLVRAGELQFEAGRRTLPQLVQLHDSRFNAEQRRAEQAHRLLQARLRQLSLSGGLLPALNLPN